MAFPCAVQLREPFDGRLADALLLPFTDERLPKPPLADGGRLLDTPLLPFTDERLPKPPLADGGRLLET